MVLIGDFDQPVFWALLSQMFRVINELLVLLVLMLLKETVDEARPAHLPILPVFPNCLIMPMYLLLLDLLLVHDVLLLLLIKSMSTTNLEHSSGILFFLMHVLPI